LATDLDSTVFGAALAACSLAQCKEVYILTLHNSGNKEPDKESTPIQSLDKLELVLVLILPASGVTIARESALDLGPSTDSKKNSSKHKELGKENKEGELNSKCNE